MALNTRVWRKFTAKSKNGDLKLRIQDMPSGRLEDVIDIFMKYFVLEETWHIAAGIHKSENAQAEYREFAEEKLVKTPHNILICCMDDDPDVVGEIVGASLMTIAKIDDPVEDLSKLVTRTEELGKFFKLVNPLAKEYSVMKKLQLDSVYEDVGVVVHPNYRGLGMAQKFFNVRRKVCQEAGVPLTAAWMSTAGSQKAADRDGWKTAFEISFEELGKELGIVFENVPPTCKYMIAKPLPID